MADNFVDYASKEVVMSAGALRSPQLLMLSGIGPIDVLESVGINCVKDLPVGQALRDHLCIPLLWEVDQSLARPVDWVLDETAVVQHRQEFLASGAGPLKNFYSPMPVVYTRDAGIVSWNAMNELSPAARRHLANPNLPLTEICPVLPSFGPDKSNGYLRVSAFPMATQSTGSIKLHSASIKDQPLVDPQYLSTKFDVQNAISSVRAVNRAMRDSSLSPKVHKFAMGPKSDSDEGILQYIKQSATSAYHYSCSVRMGPLDDGMSCLDKDFKVFGVQNLRVGDTSALPFLPQCHTQAVAYLIGEILSEKLLKEYSL